jgi:glutaredoxin
MTEITLLTKADCGLCDDAKAVLERLRSEFALQIATIDISSHAGQVLAMQAGVIFPPGVLLDGLPFSYGRLSERKLRRELETSRAPKVSDA